MQSIFLLILRDLHLKSKKINSSLLIWYIFQGIKKIFLQSKLYLEANRNDLKGERRKKPKTNKKKMLRTDKAFLNIKHDLIHLGTD